MRRTIAAPVASAFLTGFVGLTIWAAHLSEFLAPTWSLVLLTTLLTVYLVIEINRVKRCHGGRWLINPAVMCSIMTFALGFGPTNFIYFLPEAQLAYLGARPEVDKWMVHLLALTLLAAISMWLAYWSPFAARAGRKLQRSRALDRILRDSWNFRTDAMVLLVVTSLVSRFISIRLGVYGFSSDPDRLIAGTAYTQYLSLGGELGKLALVLAALRHFSTSERSLGAARWFWALLGLEVAFGLLSGFKSQVAMPIVIAGVAMYVRQGSLPWRWVALVPLALTVAYAAIEPFRIARHQDHEFQGTSITYIARTMIKAYSGDSGFGAHSSPDEPSTTVTVLARGNYLQMGSLGIEYAHRGPIPEGTPDFLLDIFLAPAYAVLPRALFDFKPTGDLGTWYRIEVLGIKEGNTSVAMGPVTYLYLAGGVVAVALGFFFVGTVQRIVADALLASPKAGAALPFLILLPGLAVIGSGFYPIIVNLVRYTPMALVLQRMLYRR